MMNEEIFGPILTVYVYEDSELDATLGICDTASPYALTGGCSAAHRAAVYMAGPSTPRNFYLTTARSSRRPIGW